MKNKTKKFLLSLGFSPDEYTLREGGEKKMRKRAVFVLLEPEYRNFWINYHTGSLWQIERKIYKFIVHRDENGQ